MIQSLKLCFMAALAGIGIMSAGVVHADVCIFVSAVNGNDTYAGTFAAPFKTIGRAKQQVQIVKQTATGPIGVYLRAGTYYLDSALIFGITDGGSAASPITYTAYLGEKVIISGGKRVTSVWTVSSGSVMVTALSPNMKLDQLFLNGKRQVMARYPNYDSTARLQGYAADCISPTRVARWANPVEGPGYIRGIHGNEWGGNSFIITAKNSSNNTLTTAWVGDNNRGSSLHATYRMVENIFEELDAPGEWFYRKSNGNLYFYPPAGTNLSTATIEVASLEELIKITGSAATKIKYLTFNGLTFTQTHRTLFTRTFEKLLRGDWCVVRAGALFIQDAENITIKHCVFDQVGGNGIFMSGYDKNHMIYNNTFTMAGATCVAAVGLSSAVRSPSTWENQLTTIPDQTAGPLTLDFPTLVTISNNQMLKMGQFEKQTSGVCLAMAAKITVIHNTVTHCPRAGMNINDGTWGGHRIEYNDISDCVRETGDHGPFNSWGRDRFWSYGGYCTDGCNGTLKQPFAKLDAMDSTIIRCNRIQDYDKGYFGIDLDDGSSNYSIYKNLLLGCGVKLREGFFRKVYNNILVNGQQHIHVWYAGGRDSIYRNIVINGNSYDNIGANIVTAQAYIDRNLFWNNGSAVTISTKAAGGDANSVTADPMFTNAATGDYRVATGSPALTLGFVNFPMDSFGKMNVPVDTLGSQCVTSAVAFLPLKTFMQGISRTGNRLTVFYSLGRSGLVSINIMSISGRRIANLLDRSENAGEHAVVWSFDRKIMTALYLVTLEADGKKITEKLMRIR